MAQILSSNPGPAQSLPGAKSALALLLAINLFNYVDRQVLSAVLPSIQKDASILHLDDQNTKLKLGMLTSAFMVSYMLFSMVFGWLDGRGARRWVIIGCGVSVWSIASGASGLATGYWMLFLTRCIVGIGEAAYNPIASAMLADLFPLAKRGKVIAIFNLAIPVGSALGFLVGGLVAEVTGHWRPAFYVTFVGIGLGLLCFLRRETPRPTLSAADKAHPRAYSAILRELLGNRSYLFCCVGMTSIVFVIGGIAAWVPAYIFEREGRFVVTAEKLEAMRTPAKSDTAVPEEVISKIQPLTGEPERKFPAMKKELSLRLTQEEAETHASAIFDATKTPATPSLTSLNVTFGGILVFGGIAATILGTWLAEKLRTKVRGAYFWVIGCGALLAAPCYLGMLFVPFPFAWILIFFAIIGLFLHTGPAFTAIANVTRSPIRATAFAWNILIIHALGDAISPTIIGTIADATDLQTAFICLVGFILLGGGIWCFAARFLDADTQRVLDLE